MQPCGNDRQLLLHAVGVGGDGLSKILRQFKKLGYFRMRVCLSSALTPNTSAMKFRYLMPVM